MRILLTLLLLAPLCAQNKRAELSEVARVATVMVDGDLAQRIMTERALQRMIKPDPREGAGDDFEVRHEPFIQTKKALIRLSRLVPYPCDVNLWMPIPGLPGKIQILIRNVNEMSQFWPWGALQQNMIPHMRRVLATGERVVVAEKPEFLSVLAPVYNSLGDVVGLVEVVARERPDPRENVK
ncbi:MAG: hypothetical protein HYR60_09405 [Acidobacteria bacterium]|nr:hypothetical protein [Acidobacteriota bacterium]